MLGKMEIRTPPGSRPRDGRHCDLCGCSQPAVRCDKCGCQIFCLSCDDMYHRHPKRRFHLRKAVDPLPAVTQARPVLPVKVSHLNATNPGDPSKMPLPPPRKKKSIFGSFRKPSPSSDNSPPLPKKEYSWTDRLGSIKKFMSNRPLPPLPTSDDNDMEPQPTTNGQSSRGDLSFIHKRSEDRPPQLPQRSPRSPEFPGVNQEKENRIPSSPPHMPGQIRNGSLEPNANHLNQNHEFLSNEENHWNNRMNNQNSPQAFGTLNRQSHQRGFMPPGVPGHPGGMHQSSSATDLHNLHNAEGMVGAGPVPPHYPHYPMNPHMPPHYPYPMYPQYPNYPQYFGNSFANLSNPPTSEGDFSDSESTSRHSSKKHPFRKRAKRSQSVMMDKMAYPGQFFPFGPYPGYGPWGAPMPMEAPPSPASSMRSLNRTGRNRRRKKTTSEDDDEELSETSSAMSRPKSSSSDPKEQPRARQTIARQTTSSEDESDDNIDKRRSDINTIRRQSEPVRMPSPAMEPKRVAKLKKSSSKQSDSDTQEIPEVKTERRQSDSTTEQQQPARQSSLLQQIPVRQSPILQQSPVLQSPVRQSPVRQSPVRQSPLPQQSPIPQQVSAQQRPSTSSSASPDCWECKHCTFINPIENRICQVCCKTASPRTGTPASAHSRPTSSAASNRKGSAGSEQECSSPDKVPESEDSSKERQDMASLNSALDEAEKQISRGLEELMKLKDDIDSNISKEKSKTSENQSKSENEENSKPIYKSSGRMRTSILDKLNLNKPHTSNSSVSTSTETQSGQNNWTSNKIIEARRHSNSSTASETYNSPMAQSPELETGFPGNKQKRDSSCQTQQDTIAEYLEKRKAAEEAFLGRPVNNFGFGYGDRMDMVTSPVPSMYDRFFGGGYGMMQRSHSRASLFAGRMNDMGPMDYGPGFGYGPTPMYRSVSRGSLTGEYPDGRMSEFNNWRKPDFYLSMEELVERRRQDNIRAQGLELVRMIREAEQQGFNADDIQVALTHCGKQNPMEWLQDNWRNMVDSVVTLSTNYGNDKKENDIGVLSENEARDALRLHKGNIWAAVTECVEGRQRKYLELSARGNFSRQDIVDALTSSEGDVEMAYAKLTKSTGKPFLMRIWGQGEGVQNQDGAQPIPEDFNDGPRRYLKDETVNSDEFSDDLWSEDGDGVEWDEEEDYDEEKGDIEELRTCHEDLQASPQEMMTPESEKSDYCDAFAVDDRNASSPSDDIFFVIPEAKPEKKKGFLSKLAAFRKDSKEQADTVTNVSKDEFPPEQALQSKEDSISQKSSSSSEQPKNNGAFSTLKNTLSAIKDSVTGGSKNDKKVPCAQPEKRTIIVRGQIDHETLNTDTDNVKLTSMNPLDDDSSIVPKLEIQSKDQTKHAEDSLIKEVAKSDKDTNNKAFKDNINENIQIKIDKSNSENVTKQTESNKTENKKPQSLAERLKFAKQTRSSATAAGSSGIKKESYISDTTVKEDVKAEPKKEKQLQNQENSKHSAEKERSTPEMKVSQIPKVENLEKHKPEDSVAHAIQSNQKISEKGTHKERNVQNEVQSVTITSAESIPVFPPEDVPKESKAATKTESSKSDTLQTETQNAVDLQNNQIKQTGTSSKCKTEDITDKKANTESKSQRDLKKADLLRVDETSENSNIASAKKNGESGSTEISEVVKQYVEPKYDASKPTPNLSQNNISSDIKATNSQAKKSKVKEITAENVSNEISVAPNIAPNLQSNDVKETVPKEATFKISDEAPKPIKEVNKTVEQTESKIDIPKTLTETSDIPTVSIDAKSGFPETSTNQKTEIKSEKSVIEGNKNQELMVTTTEDIAIINNENALKNIAEEISITNKDQTASTSKELPKNEFEMPTENNEISKVVTETSQTINELEPRANVQEDGLEQIPMNTEVQHSLPKPELTSENFSATQLNKELPNLSITSSSQNLPENIVEQSIVDNFKSDVDSNKNTSDIQTVLETPSECCIPDQNTTDQNLGIENNEKDLTINEQIISPSQLSAQDNEVMQRKDEDAASTHNLRKSSESSQSSTSADLNLSKNDTTVIPPENKDSSTSSTSEDAKSVKPKSIKTSKIKKSKSQEKDKKESKESKESKDKDTTKAESSTSSESSVINSSKSQEKDKNESKDKDASKVESSKCSESSVIISPSIASDSKASTSHDEVSLMNEAVPPNKTTNEKIENKSIENEKVSNDTETVKSEDKTSEPKSSQNETIKTLEESKLQTSDGENKSSSMENASAISSEQVQNTAISTESQSALSSADVTIPTTSKEDEKTTEVQETQREPEMEQKSDISKETNQNSSEVTAKTISNETELQAPVFSKEFPDNKSNVTASVPTSSKVTEDSKITETSSITNIPDNSKTIPDSSNENVPDNSKATEASSSTNASDSSKIISSSSNANILDVSTAAASSTKVSVNSNTIPTPSSTSAPGSSKTTTASSSGLSKTVTDVKSLSEDTKSSVPEQNEKHSKVRDAVITDIPPSTSEKVTPVSPVSIVSSTQSTTLQRTVSEDDESKPVDSDDTDIEYSDDSRSNSVIPPSPVDALRSRFEGLADGTTVRGAPMRPASPFRRMSFNSRKQVIALEKKRDISADKPWFRKKILPEPVKIVQPKRTIRQQLEMERRVRQMVSDRKCRTYRKAEIVVQLMDMNFEEEEAIQAANECSTLEQAISYLQQECLLCVGYYPVSQIISMTHCEHRACRECIRAYFTVQIRDRTILDLLCPFCNEPDIGDEDIAQDYFNHLDIMLKKLVDIEIHELFQRKLRDRVLMKDPNFRWCSQCSSGFIAMPNLTRLICPDCNAVTCASCRRLWEKEHQGISCEAFAALKDATDPEAQAAGLAKMLTEDGISCPSCHFRYALAKGGCMHFRCIQCQHDFCSGCSRPFKMGQKCGVSEFCAKLGLHAHHPRNCLFYLRDKEPEDLQKLLDMNDVKYNRESPEGMELSNTCQVLEQKETADGMIDDNCGKEIQDGYAGLCRVHYVEYLGQLVNKHKVDPIQIFDNDDLELVLRRANIRLPPKRYRETDAGYREKLINVIKEELPLDKMDGS